MCSNCSGYEECECTGGQVLTPCSCERGAI